jgi:hypothetical protein
MAWFSETENRNRAGKNQPKTSGENQSKTGGVCYEAKSRTNNEPNRITKPAARLSKRSRSSRGATLSQRRRVFLEKKGSGSVGVPVAENERRKENDGLRHSSGAASREKTNQKAGGAVSSPRERQALALRACGRTTLEIQKAAATQKLVRVKRDLGNENPSRTGGGARLGRREENSEP